MSISGRRLQVAHGGSLLDVLFRCGAGGDRFCPYEPAKRVSKPSLQIVAVGTSEQLYKAPDVLLGAIGECSSDGVGLVLAWVGGGKYSR